MRKSYNLIQPRRWIIFSYLALMTLGIYLAFSHWAYDDPFITYRYADNIRRGLGFVYNSGERVLSTTTPLFATLLALLSTIWPDLPHLANLIGALSLALGGVLLWDLGRSWDAPAVSWAGVLLYPTFPLVVSTLGSETPLYLALCLGAFAFYARDKYRWVGVFSALAILTRADGILVPALLGLDYILRNVDRISNPAHLLQSIRRIGNPPYKAIFLFAALLAPWVVFSWLYFGSPFPATLTVKQQQGLMSISTLFAPGFLRVAGWYRFGWQYWVEAGLAIIGVIWAIRRARRWLIVLAWPLLYFAAYTYLGVTSYFWYYAPLVPGFVVAVGLGVSGTRNQRLGTRDQELGSGRWSPEIGRRSAVSGRRSVVSGRRSVVSGRWSVIITGLLLAALTLPQVSALARMRQAPDARLGIYRAVGKWLEANTPQDASVGVLEVGIIGYYSHRSMVDFAGLIQPEVATQMGTDTTYEDTAIWAVKQYRPDYLILHAEAFPRLEGGYVTRHCQPERKFLSSAHNFPTAILIYVCDR